MDDVAREQYDALFDLYRQMGDERDAALARAEAAERRVAELEVQLATMLIAPIDGIGNYVLPGPGVSTSQPTPARSE